MRAQRTQKGNNRAHSERGRQIFACAADTKKKLLAASLAHGKILGHSTHAYKKKTLGRNALTGTNSWAHHSHQGKILTASLAQGENCRSQHSRKEKFLSAVLKKELLTTSLAQGKTLWQVKCNLVGRRRQRSLRGLLCTKYVRVQRAGTGGHLLGNHAWDRKSGEREAATREKRQKARKRIVPAHDTTRLKETVSEGKGGRRREKF